MIDLCAVGDLSWLVVLSVPHIPLLGEEMALRGIERLLGNDAPIVCLLASRLGLRCHLLATNTIAIHNGQPLIDMLQQARVNTSLVNTRGVTTPTTFFLLLVDSDERACLVEDCSFRDPIPRSLPACRLAYIDLYEEHMEERLALIQRWSQTNVHCLVNLSATHIEEKVNLLAHIPSLDILQIGGSWSVKEAYIRGSRILQMCHAQAVIITLGRLGAVLVDQQSDYYIPAEPIQPLRTVGAGASFTAGFLSALVEDATYRDAAIFASKYAASFCTLEKNPLDVMKR
jgi:sugar/nucleoside kinase (ribokinase family)